MNGFGGKNPNSLYVPMTDIEQEVLHRLAPEMVVHIVGWGVVESPKVIIGDLRLAFQFTLSFNRPPTPVPVHYFELQLKTRSGMLLYTEKLPTMVEGNPIQVAAGMQLTLQWDIAIHHLDPKLVKMIKPSAQGLTSRVLDKDTGKATFAGNMHLSEKQLKELALIRQGEAASRADNRQQVRKAEKREKNAVKRGEIQKIET